jgi:hypothetical protein
MLLAHGRLWHDALVEIDAKKNLLSTLAVARSDISAARDAGLLAIERLTAADLHGPLHCALSTAVVVSYARPFVWNTPHGRIPSSWEDFPHPLAADLHERVLEHWNTAVAHPEASARVVSVIPAGVTLALRPVDDECVITVEDLAVPLEWFPLIVDLCDWLLPRLTEEIGHVVDDLYGGPEIQLPPRPFILDDGPDLIPSDERDAPGIA